MKLNIKGKFIVVKHAIAGVVVFYFIIHPLTMVIYWFEFRQIEMTRPLFFEVVWQRLMDSFTFPMLGMSTIFITLGLLIGISSGLYYKKILQKNRVLKQQEAQLERNIEIVLKAGEGEKIEFKSSLRYDFVNSKMNKGLEKVFLKTITGFLNAQGGTLLIGVDDQGNPLGLLNDYVTLRKQNRDGFELRLMQLIASQIGTEFCSLIHITFYKLNENDICSVDVSASSAPAYMIADGKTIFYLRTGNSTKQLTVQETVNYLRLNQ